MDNIEQKRGRPPVQTQQQEIDQAAVDFGNQQKPTISDDPQAFLLHQFLSLQGDFKPRKITGVESKQLPQEIKDQNQMKKQQLQDTLKELGLQKKKYFFIRQQCRLNNISIRYKVFRIIYKESHLMNVQQFQQDNYKQMCMKLNLLFEILENDFSKSLEYLAINFYQSQLNGITKPGIIDSWKQLIVKNEEQRYKEINDWISVKKKQEENVDHEWILLNQLYESFQSMIAL